MASEPPGCFVDGDICLTSCHDHGLVKHDTCFGWLIGGYPHAKHDEFRCKEICTTELSKTCHKSEGFWGNYLTLRLILTAPNCSQCLPRFSLSLIMGLHGLIDWFIEWMIDWLNDDWLIDFWLNDWFSYLCRSVHQSERFGCWITMMWSIKSPGHTRKSRAEFKVCSRISCWLVVDIAWYPTHVYEHEHQVLSATCRQMVQTWQYCL